MSYAEIAEMDDRQIARVEFFPRDEKGALRLGGRRRKFRHAPQPTAGELRVPEEAWGLRHRSAMSGEMISPPACWVVGAWDFLRWRQEEEGFDDAEALRRYGEMVEKC